MLTAESSPRCLSEFVQQRVLDFREVYRSAVDAHHPGSAIYHQRTESLFGRLIRGLPCVHMLSSDHDERDDSTI